MRHLDGGEALTIARVGGCDIFASQESASDHRAWGGRKNTALLCGAEQMASASTLHHELEQLRLAGTVSGSPVVRREAEATAGISTQLMEALQQLQREQDVLEEEAARVAGELAEQKRLNGVQADQISELEARPSSEADTDKDAEIAELRKQIDSFHATLDAEADREEKAALAGTEGGASVLQPQPQSQPAQTQEEAARVAGELAEQKRLNGVQADRISELEARLGSDAGLERDIAHIARKCDELNDLNQRLVAEHNEQADAFQAEMTALKAAAAAATSERKAASSRADLLEDQLSGMRAEAAMQIGQHERTLAAATAAADEAAAQLHAAQKSVREAEDKAAESAEHAKQTDALHAEVAALKAANPPDPRQSQEWQEAVAAHAAETASLRAQLSALEVRMEHLKTERDAGRSELIDELRNDLDALQAEKEAWTSLASVEEETTRQSEDTQRAEEELRRAREESQRLLKDAEMKDAEIAELRKQIESFHATLDAEVDREEKAALAGIEGGASVLQPQSQPAHKQETSDEVYTDEDFEDVSELDTSLDADDDTGGVSPSVIELQQRLVVVEAEKVAATEKIQAIESWSAAAEREARSRIEELEKQLAEVRNSTADTEVDSDAGSFYSADEAAANLSKERTSAELEEQRSLAGILSAQLADAVEKQKEMAAVTAGLERAVQEEKDLALVTIEQMERAVQDEKDKSMAAVKECEAASSHADLLEDQLSGMRAEAAMQQGQYERAVASANKAADEAAAQLHAAQKSVREAENKAAAMSITLGGKAQVEVRCAQLSERVEQLEGELTAAQAAAQAHESHPSTVVQSERVVQHESAAEQQSGSEVQQVDSNKVRTVVQSERPQVDVVSDRVVQHESAAEQQSGLEAQQAASMQPQDVSTAAPSTERVAEDKLDSALHDEMHQRILQKEEEILQKEQQILEHDEQQKAVLAQVAVLLQDQEEHKRQLAEASKSLVDERTAGADMTVALDAAYRRVSELEAELKELKSASTMVAEDATQVVLENKDDTGADAARHTVDRERMTELEAALGVANAAAKEAQERLLRSESAESAAEGLLRQREEQLAQLQLERATAAAEAAMAETPSRSGAGSVTTAASQQFSPPPTPASLAQADALAVRVGELEQQLQASDAMYEELQAETISKEQELSNMGRKLRELRNQVRSQPSSPPRGPTVAELESEREERAREAAQKAEVVEALKLASEELKEAQAELETLRDAKETWEIKAAAAEKKHTAAVRQRRQRRSGAEGADAAALEEAESEIDRLKGCIEELVAQLGVLEAASRKARAAVSLQESHLTSPRHGTLPAGLVRSIQYSFDLDDGAGPRHY